MSDQINSPWRHVQDAIAERIADLSPWGGPKVLDVVKADEGDMLNKLRRLLLKSKIGVLISTPAARPREDHPWALDVTVTLDVIENVAVNRGRADSYSGTDLVWVLLKSLVFDRDWRGADGTTTPGQPLDFAGVELAEQDDPRLQVHEMQLTTAVILIPQQ